MRPKLSSRERKDVRHGLVSTVYLHRGDPGVSALLELAILEVERIKTAYDDVKPEDLAALQGEARAWKEVIWSITENPEKAVPTSKE